MKKLMLVMAIVISFSFHAFGQNTPADATVQIESLKKGLKVNQVAIVMENPADASVPLVFVVDTSESKSILCRKAFTVVGKYFGDLKLAEAELTGLRQSADVIGQLQHNLRMAKNQLVIADSFNVRIRKTVTEGKGLTSSEIRYSDLLDKYDALGKSYEELMVAFDQVNTENKKFRSSLGMHGEQNGATDIRNLKVNSLREAYLVNSLINGN